MAPRTLLDWALKQDTDQCIDWPYATATGYGAIRIDYKFYRVHALVCERVHGPKPSPKHQAAHLCGRRICINPRHIRWATPSENEQDKVMHGLSNRGQRNGRAKLTANDVRSIRQEYASGNTTQRALAVRFGISQPTVSEIVTGKRWDLEDHLQGR